MSARPITTADLWDNTETESRTTGAMTYAVCGTASRLVVTTSARFCTVRVYVDAGMGAFQVGFRANGVDVCAINPMADGSAQTLRALLPAGMSKTVEIVAAERTAASAGVAPAGIYFVDVDFDASFTVQPPPTNSARIVVVGDSVTGGSVADVACLRGCWPLVRQHYSGSITVDAYGYRFLQDIAADGTKISAFVAKIVATNPSKIIIALGLNDWLGGGSTAAIYGTRYGALLDALIAALPSAPILCASPTITTGREGAGGSGDTMAVYRSQVSSVASARPAYCTFVDGTALVSSDYVADDGVHLTTGGQAIMAASWRAILGI